ncbi:MAG: hypothetical protein XE11_1210 [Methanomicrobiales archaeon 53_19]|jgi:succinate dehydrogenase hydrophobic anchor subunit|uniref:hypothetical protein n=1 Tax=Methanocalculus sp. TaxID=2004547 RepID=UPI00074B0298|nr:hypothetical protein [Methanocalculus sp.]KUK70605.1 MAG: hypothetical protein XD88_0549 [Methanocalculus sp. 52_23]KUL03495.1 MAG: hypothetical protein XE11_1210 [Methanomicrobiales archaeon 53_19]HIJ06716.1 hypothetical protein [Methanocalculus sp.]
MTIAAVAYTQVLGLPLVVVLGIILFISLCITASIAIIKRRGRLQKVPFTWHFRMAGISILIALLHAILGISVYIRDLGGSTETGRGIERAMHPLLNNKACSAPAYRKSPSTRILIPMMIRITPPMSSIRSPR